MPDSVLDILKLVLLVMLYLFVARVLIAVWSEVRQPAQGRGIVEQPPVMPAGARRPLAQVSPKRRLRGKVAAHAVHAAAGRGR